MAYLGFDFIISSLIWLFLVFIFVFIFRKQILAFFYKQTSFDLFISKLKHYLENTYPDINFNYDIIESSKIEQNPQTRKYLIISNIINQYLNIQLDTTKYPTGMPDNLHWSGYAFNSVPNRNKLPSDWLQRKNALLIRDNKKCFRCSKQLDINSINVYMIRPLESDGKYFLENLLSVCKDCEKILSGDPKKMNYLDIKENLNEIVKDTP